MHRRRPGTSRLLLTLLLMLGCGIDGPSGCEDDEQQIEVATTTLALNEGSAGERLLLASEDHARLSVLDPGRREVTLVDTGQCPRDLAIAPSGDFAVTADACDDTLTLIEFPQLNTQTLPTGQTPFEVLIEADSERVWSAHEDDADLIVHDLVRQTRQSIGLNMPTRRLLLRDTEVWTLLGPPYILAQVDRREERLAQTVTVKRIDDTEFLDAVYDPSGDRFVVLRVRVLPDEIETYLTTINPESKQQQTTALPNLAGRSLAIDEARQTAWVGGIDAQTPGPEFDLNCMFLTDCHRNLSKCGGALFEIDLDTGAILRELLPPYPIDRIALHTGEEMPYGLCRCGRDDGRTSYAMRFNTEDETVVARAMPPYLQHLIAVQSGEAIAVMGTPLGLLRGLDPQTLDARWELPGFAVGDTP